VERVETLTSFHIEFDCHDVLIADGKELGWCAYAHKFGVKLGSDTPHGIEVGLSEEMLLHHRLEERAVMGGVG